MIDQTKLAAIRTALAAARSGSDAQRIAALTRVVDDLLAALTTPPLPSAPGLTVTPQGDVTIRAQQSITLTTGLSSLVLTPQGDVSIKGNSVSVKTNGDVPISGAKLRDENSGKVIVRGSKIGSN